MHAPCGAYAHSTSRYRRLSARTLWCPRRLWKHTGTGRPTTSVNVSTVSMVPLVRAHTHTHTCLFTSYTTPCLMQGWATAAHQLQACSTRACVRTREDWHTRLSASEPRWCRLWGPLAGLACHATCTCHTKVPRHQGIMSPRHHSTRVPQHQGTTAPGHHSTRAPQHQGTTAPGYRSTRVPQQLTYLPPHLPFSLVY